MITLTLTVPGSYRTSRGKNEPQGACSGSEHSLLIEISRLIPISQSRVALAGA